ncbi:MAG: hypothetical protein U0Q07_14125 [Acidimicrobiales bacterium]
MATALAGLAPFPVAAVLSVVPVRSAAVLTLVAMAVVVAVAAWIGGWRAGLAAAVVAGLSATSSTLPRCTPCGWTPTTSPPSRCCAPSAC